jgi:membrane-associated phospholipid phosphatase
MYKSPLYFAIFLLIVVQYHRHIQDDVEKLLFLEYFGYDNVKRPSSGNIMNSTRDLGMPSGHAESATIMFLLLYFYGYISLPVSIILIFLVSLQRVLAQRHSIAQVTVGTILGLIYSYIYKSYNFSIFSFLIVISITFLLTALIYYKVYNK